MVSHPTPPPDWRALLQTTPGPLLLQIMEAGRGDRDYASWDKVRRRRTPDGLSSEQWWLGIKLSRTQQYREVEFRDAKGNPFVYGLPDTVLSALDDVSRRAGGTVMAPELVANHATRDRYLINSLIEEAITSSQLEGAATTHRVAKDMLRTGRPPRNHGEKMIANNFRAMQFVRDNVAEEITPGMVSELHRIVTEGTLENPSDAGRLQLPGEPRVGVWSNTDDVQVHVPPPAEELPGRLDRLCRFANGTADHRWMHPVLRAIIAHFMVGYDHYFTDGNGRTARALFYWVALKNGLWLMEFVAISRILRDAPARYARAYLHTESDDGDLTYFVLHQLGVIQRSIDDLHEYLTRKAREVHEARQLVSGLSLNHRQIAVVEGSLRDPSLVATASSHAASHGVALATARSDLRSLTELGLLESHHRGRAEVWRPVPDLVAVLEERRFQR